MQIYVHLPLGETEKKILEKGVAGANLVYAQELQDENFKKEKFLASEIGFGNVPPEWVAEASQLRWLQLESVGFDKYQSLDWNTIGRQLTVTNLKGMFGVPVAETALAGILGLFRGIDQLAVLQSKHEWIGNPLRPYLRTLHGKSILIMGTGSIGKTLKRMLEPYQGNILMMGKSKNKADITEEELDLHLPEVDILINCLPDTQATQGLVAKYRLDLLKRDAIFVNVGRGTVVDEKALIEALNAGEIGGSVIDVSLEEPLPEDHPFWDCPNTILTQHTAGGTTDEVQQKVEIFLENLKHYKAGKPLNNEVDFKQGY